MACKICIIGAGSAIFSLNLIKDICVNEHFKGCTVSLMDINEDRLDAIYGLCTRYASEMNADINVIMSHFIILFLSEDKRDVLSIAERISEADTSNLKLKLFGINFDVSG